MSFAATVKLSEIEEALKHVLHKLDVKRIDVFLMRQQAQDDHILKLRSLQIIEGMWTSMPIAIKLYWEGCIEHDKARADAEIRMHDIVVEKIAVLAERLKGMMKMDGPEAWRAELQKIIDDYEIEG